MPLVTGQVLQNRYRIDALLGKGGMGAVYRATDLRFNAVVAVKENLDLSPDAQHQFATEAGILFHLHHPNLPRVSDYFALPGYGQYLVMDYIVGEDLGQILARGPIPEHQALAWAGQVLDALEYLHAQNPPIIHRDVKPANVKIAPEGRVYLVDFGLAKTFDPARPTTAGARAVTPGYAPPEQYGVARTDARTDLYALGATLYALLTGHEPPESVDLMVGNAALIPPRRINPAISSHVEAAILQAMDTRPTGRPQTTAQFRALLSRPGASRAPAYVTASAAQQATAAKPLPVPTSRAPSAGAAPRQRSYWAWAGLAALALLVVLGAAWGLGRLGGGDPATPTTSAGAVPAVSPSPPLPAPTHAPSETLPTLPTEGPGPTGTSLPPSAVPDTATPVVVVVTATPLPSPTAVEIAGPFSGQVVTVRVPVADVWREPHPGTNQERETQVLMGEQLQITEIGSGWYRVVVLEQPSSKDPRGYPGWVPAGDVILRSYDPDPKAIVMVPSAYLRQEPGSSSPAVAEVSLDTRLQVVAQESGWLQLALPDGSLAWIQVRQVRLEGTGYPRHDPSPAAVIQTAQSLVGITYMWGGSSWKALDCSGVTYRSFHAHGILLARDSKDQAQGGGAVAMQDLEAGDLVFYAVGGPSGTVSHVGLYIGGGQAIATYAEGKVAQRPFDSSFSSKQYWGARRYW